jgi:hypothetical protein
METSIVGTCLVSLYFLVLSMLPSLASESPHSTNITVMRNNLTARGVSTSDCGLHALYCAAVMVDRAPSISDLFGDLSDRVDGRGLSLEQLSAIATRNNLHVSFVSGLSAQDIDWATCPIIIPLQMNAGTGLNHWVTVCGVENGVLNLFDSVDLQSQRSRAEINSVWYGDAIIVGATDGDVRTCRMRLVVGSMLRKVAVLAFGCLIALIGWWR